MEKEKIKTSINDLIEKEMIKIGDKCGVLEIGKVKYAVFTEDSGNEILKLLDYVFEETYALCSAQIPVEEAAEEVEEESFEDAAIKATLENIEPITGKDSPIIEDEKLKLWECPSCGTRHKSLVQPVTCDCGRRGGFAEIKDEEDLE